MSDFISRFFICNVFICLFTLILFMVKWGLRKYLSPRMQYKLWFLLLILLIVPFLPLHLTGFADFSTWLAHFLPVSTVQGDALHAPSFNTVVSPSLHWMNDFAISVDKLTPDSPSVFFNVIGAIWIPGILAILFFMIRSRIKFLRLERSALPLQNQKAARLFSKCCQELCLSREIPVYSTAFLKSPVTVGLIHPRIYLPIHLISDYNEADMRYMLLHELSHYKRKDALGNTLMNLAVAVYWFHPLIWYARKTMFSDREIACDSDVLQLLSEEDYTDYGNTLLHYAEKISRFSFPFASGIGGTRKQLKRRILNIASYHPETTRERRSSRCIFLLLALLLIGMSAFFPVSVYAEDIGTESAYTRNIHTASTSSGNNGTTASHTENADTFSEDLSSLFQGYDGCFVLYDLTSDSWQIYNEAMASERVSPDSTYKIYSALCALEHQVITPTSNTLEWNGQEYSFSEWNQNQTLSSALQNSVNWYFQELDESVGLKTLEGFYQNIGYGNQNLSGGVSNFWMESSLKISAIEQVELLKKLYDNAFDFKQQNMNAVKDAMLLSSSTKGTLHGKTGTGVVNGEMVNGWFVGYVESAENTWFFATNIQGNSDAGGSAASEITLDILRELGIY